jgi:ABC-2 type transport system ATP-binding protein
MPTASPHDDVGMTAAVRASELRKTFGPTVALDGLDLEVAPGEVHGFLGPNGSGKSVTIRILLGLLRADSGEVSLLGGDPWNQAVELHRHIAYVPGDVNLWPTLSGGEVIDLLARMRGGIDPAKRADLVERLDLDPTKKARTYSKGNRQKVALVAALASDAELLLLDEPTAGLDPLMEAVFQECILEVKREGRTVLLSSHILAEVEKLCDRLTIIRKGRTVEQGTLTELRHMTRTTVEAESRVSGGSRPPVTASASRWRANSWTRPWRCSPELAWRRSRVRRRLSRNCSSATTARSSRPVSSKPRSRPLEQHTGRGTGR